MSPAMVAAAAVAGEVVDVREIGCGRSVDGHRDASRVIDGPRPAAARRRHRHRPHHPGALPAVRSRSTASSEHAVRGRSRSRPARADPSVRRPALRRRARSCSSTATSAAARRASTRRRRIARWGIRAVVGESFAEIFFGNSVALGLPCVTACARADAESLQPLIERRCRRLAITVDVEQRRRSRPAIARSRQPAGGGAAGASSTASWDATGLLLDDYEEVEAIAARLPYVDALQRL